MPELNFHALAPTEDGICAAESPTAGVWLLSPGGEWEQRGEIEVTSHGGEISRADNGGEDCIDVDLPPAGE